VVEPGSWFFGLLCLWWQFLVNLLTRYYWRGDAAVAHECDVVGSFVGWLGLCGLWVLISVVVAVSCTE
jgi:hypothetical protein